MPKLDIDAMIPTNTTGYPVPFAQAVAGRWVRRIGREAGFTDFGASHVVLKPGAWSSQRHWHEAEDELVVLISGEATLVDDAGPTVLRPGDIAVFRKGDGNGHHIRNDSADDVIFLAIGRAPSGSCHYPDIDMAFEGGKGFTRRDGSAFEESK